MCLTGICPKRGFGLAAGDASTGNEAHNLMAVGNVVTAI